MGQLGLIPSVRQEDQKRWLRHILAIPFLPANNMIVTVETHLTPNAFFAESQLEPDEQNKIGHLFSYVCRFWLRRVGPAKLSVYDSRRRTNNDVESYHRNLGRRLSIHSNVWTFLGKS